MITQYKHYYNETSLANYNVGVYARVSREDENENSTSESIVNQTDFLERIVYENGWNLVKTYYDDGISGTTFDRPQFNEMINDIERGKINLVITKDLSRLGRDYIQTGYYIENYFPSKKVRYIAVNDNLDTFNDDNNNDFIPFKSVFNDMYAKDISKKVKTALKTKQVEGSFLGTNAPYGYMKKKENKGKLIIDPVSSKYVKKIFNMFLSGGSIIGIANQLTVEGIPTPSQYSKITYTQKYLTGLWNDKTVRFILKNEVYIGHMVQNKKKKVNYKVDKQVEIPQNQWIKVENTHEPIIDIKDFNLVQEILKKRSFNPPGGEKHLLTGFAFCGHCNTPYTYARQHKAGKYYVLCGTAKRHTKLKLCKTYMIKEEVLIKFILSTLKDVCNEYIDADNVINNSHNQMVEDMIAELQKEKKQLEVKVENSKNVTMSLYMDKVNGVIDDNMFKELTAKINTDKASSVNQINRLQDEISQLINRTANDDMIKEDLKRFLEFEKVDRIILAKLIKKIVIYHDNTIDIHFTFRKPIKKV